MSYPEFCPACKADLQGEPISEEAKAKGWYGTATHFSRVIGWYDRGHDRTTHWICPDCKHQWERT